MEPVTPHEAPMNMEAIIEHLQGTLHKTFVELLEAECASLAMDEPEDREKLAGIFAKTLAKSLMKSQAQAQTQLARCAHIAASELNPTEVEHPGSPNWTPAYQAVLNLRVKYEQTLGRLEQCQKAKKVLRRR